jgi:hypothetical protein
MPFNQNPTKSKNVRLFSSGSLVVVDYQQTGTVEVLEELLRFQQSVVLQKGHLTLLQVVTGPMGKMDDAVKKKAAEITKLMEKALVGSAIVIPGTSLGAMMIRTVVTGINMLSRSATPSKCFGTIPEAVAFLHSLPGQHADVRSIGARDVEALFEEAVRKAA